MWVHKAYIYTYYYKTAALAIVKLGIVFMVTIEISLHS